MQVRKALGVSFFWWSDTFFFETFDEVTLETISWKKKKSWNSISSERTKYLVTLAPKTHWTEGKQNPVECAYSLKYVDPYRGGGASPALMWGRGAAPRLGGGARGRARGGVAAPRLRHRPRRRRRPGGVGLGFCERVGRIRRGWGPWGRDEVRVYGLRGGRVRLVVVLVGPTCRAP